MRPGYDRLSTRRFEFVRLWNSAVFFVYAWAAGEVPDVWGGRRTGALGREIA
jgi:hypothetical protein